MKTILTAAATSLVGTGLLAGCYVIPIESHYSGSEPLPGHGTQAIPSIVQARLYPLNEIAGKMGALTVSLSDSLSGHASFSLMHAGELLQGEATRVGPNYPGFGKVHREVYGDGRMAAGERGIASAAGLRGMYVNCEYAITDSRRGAGACVFSNGAKYQLHFGG